MTGFVVPELVDEPVLVGDPVGRSKPARLWESRSGFLMPLARPGSRGSLE
jgi:hypothetical protein